MDTLSSSQLTGEQHGVPQSEYQPFLQTSSRGDLHTSENHGQGAEAFSSSCVHKNQGVWLAQGKHLWRPLWVRRRVFILFAAWFAIMAASIEILLAVSEKQNGFSEPKGGLFYVWTFGPTAAFVITAAFWARVEYQSILSMPWIQLKKELSSAQTTVDLDYNSKLLPVLIMASVRNRHYAVTVAVVTGLVLKALIALSSGLLFLEPGTFTTRESSLPFKDSMLTQVPLFDAANITFEAYDTFLGMTTLNLTAPFGYSPKLAYQTYSVSHTGVNDSSSAVVQGIWSDLICEEAEVSIIGDQDVSSKDATLTVSLDSTFCNSTISAELSVIRKNESSAEEYNYILDGYFGPGGGSICTGADGPVFALGYAWFVGSVESSTDLDQSMVLFCQPKYYSGYLKLNISGNSPPRVEKLSSPDPILLQGDMGWLVRRSYQIHERGYTPNLNLGTWQYNSSGFWPTSYSSRAPNEYPTEMKMGYLILGQPRPTDWRNVTFDSAFHAIREFYQTFDPIVAHFFLRENETNEVTVDGFVTEIRSRLRSKPLISHVMSAFLGVSAAVFLLASTLLIPSKSFVPRHPGKLIGAVQNLSNSTAFLSSISKIGQTPFKVSGNFTTSLTKSQDGANASKASTQFFSLLSYNLGNRKIKKSGNLNNDLHIHNPVVLRLSVQVVMLITVTAALFSIQMLFIISKTSYGIGDPSSNAYIHYAWTTVPTFVMVAIGAYFTSSDKEVKALMPFSGLMTKTPFWIIDTDFSDRTAVEALWLSGRTRQWPVFVTTVTSILVSFLTIFAATLFSVVQVPIHYSVQLQQEEWFASFGWINRGDQSAVVLSNSDNFTYPEWTYRNLVLPQLSVERPPEVVSDNMTVTVVVNALRPSTTCTRHPMSSTYSQYNGNQTASLQIDLITRDNNAGSWQSSCGVFWRPYCTRNPVTRNFGGPYPCFDDPAPRYFYDAGVNVTHCSTSQFVWGTLNNTTKDWDFLAAYSCTDFVEEIDVELNLQWPSLEINTKRPPKPIEKTAKRATRFWPPGDMIHSGRWFEVQDWVHRFVDLPGPRYRLPIESIGDPAAESIVLAAQLEHWALRNTQLLSITVRRLFNETAYSAIASIDFPEKTYSKSWSGLPFNGPFEPPDTRPQLEATATDYTVYRVVQNDTPTYFLTVLLIALLLLHTVVIWLVPRKVRPHNFRTIVGVARLLANSNIFDYLQNDKIEASLVNRCFRLDLVANKSEKAMYTLQVVD